MLIKIKKWTEYPGITRRGLVHAGTGQAVSAAELQERGWRLADMSYERGYRSRRDKSPERGPVYMAGGQRRGELYYLEPCYTSSNYCMRVYMVPGPGAEPVEIMDDMKKRYEPRKRTAIDGRVWWCIFDNARGEWSTLVFFGRYKTRKDAQFYIDYNIKKYGLEA